MRIDAVNVWENKDNAVEKVMVALDDRTMVGFNPDSVPNVVYEFMKTAKNHDAITLSNGRTLNAFFN